MIWFAVAVTIFLCFVIAFQQCAIADWKELSSSLRESLNDRNKTIEEQERRLDSILQDMESLGKCFVTREDFNRLQVEYELKSDKLSQIASIINK
jgi:hypothetical protein